MQNPAKVSLEGVYGNIISVKALPEGLEKELLQYILAHNSRGKEEKVVEKLFENL